jgi:CRISPR-associated endonuclease/helicase Cas3
MLAAAGEDLDAALHTAATLAQPPEPDDGIDRHQLADQLRDHLRLAGPAPAVHPDEWQALVKALTAQVEYPVNEVPRLAIKVLRHRHTADLRAEAFGELSFTVTSAALAEHLGSIGEVAARIGERIGLPPELVQAVRMGGRLHDLGKLDPRFQLWLDPSATATQPLAKSGLPWAQWDSDRRAAGWPKGGRHEELSRRLVAAWLDGRQAEWDVDLVLHVIAAHHGYGRPLIPPTADTAAADVRGEIDGEQIAVSGDLGETDWEQPARFRRCCERYGYWGLALLETVVRQADHQVSALAVV